MRRRYGRPGLVGTMARTAVIAGTATAVSENVASRSGARGRQQPQLAPPQQAQPPAGEDFLARLQKLAELRQQGLLSDEEFSAAKAKLLAG